MLKEIPRDSIFTIRLVEPLKDGFSEYHDDEVNIVINK
jgi:hypothetical protein